MKIFKWIRTLFKCTSEGWKIQRIQLGAEDVLLLSIPEGMTKDFDYRIQQGFGYLLPGVRILALPEGVKITTIIDGTKFIHLPPLTLKEDDRRKLQDAFNKIGAK